MQNRFSLAVSILYNFPASFTQDMVEKKLFPNV